MNRIYAPQRDGTWALGILLALYLLLLFWPGCASGQTYDTLAVCRAPSYWATHAGTEKHGSRNLTGELLDRWNADGGPLMICGEEITGEDAALEALCISPKQSGRLMLARQLTATALNCILSTSAQGEGGPFCSVAGISQNPCVAIFGEQVYDVFEQCNSACAAGDVPEGCIQALDCWNLGGHYDAGECLEMEDSCADNEMEGACFDFRGTQPAGSFRACTAARKNSTTIFGPVN